MTSDIQIEHNPGASRFEAHVDGLLCDASYQLVGDVMWMNHTGVPRQLEGRGIAARLVSTALAHARAQGWKVKPTCSYVAAYIQRHPETQDLLA